MRYRSLGIAAQSGQEFPRCWWKILPGTGFTRAILIAVRKLQAHIDTFQAMLQQVEHRIQTTPVCRSCPCDLVVEPAARSLHAPHRIRQRLFCGQEQHLVLLTMGGIQGRQRPAIDLQALVREK